MFRTANIRNFIRYDCQIYTFRRFSSLMPLDTLSVRTLHTSIFYQNSVVRVKSLPPPIFTAANFAGLLRIS